MIQSQVRNSRYRPLCCLSSGTPQIEINPSVYRLFYLFILKVTQFITTRDSSFCFIPPPILYNLSLDTIIGVPSGVTIRLQTQLWVLSRHYLTQYVHRPLCT